MVGWLMWACSGTPESGDSAIDSVVSSCPTWFPDFDGDGWGSGRDGVVSCEAVAGHSETPGDCDDQRADVHPEAVEVCDDADQDCDSSVDESLELTWFADADGDGHGDSAAALQDCAQPEGTSATGGDCDDEDAAVHPDAPETCNGMDDDCDRSVDEAGRTIYRDADFDGFGDPDTSKTSCADQDGWVSDDSDCDDGSAATYPGAEDGCDGRDNDCDSAADEGYRADWTLVTVNGGGVVYEVDPATAALNQVGDLDTDGSRPTTTDVSDAGLSILQDSDTLALVAFDVCTEETTVIGPHGRGQINGIAFDGAGQLFGLDAETDELVQLDTTTGDATVIGPLGIDLGRTGMAYDCANDVIYGVDADSETLFEVDTSSGQAVNLQPLPLEFEYVGLEYNPRDGTLWASTGPRLFAIDPSGGSITYVGDFGKDNVNDLALHPGCP